MPVDPATSSFAATRVDGNVPTMPVRAPASTSLSRIDRFVVLRKLGEGGMGVVYAAYDDELERKVAIKVLRGEFRGNRQSVGQARLQREAQAMARLSHPNVAQVYQVGTIDGGVFIAMEFVSGGNLSEWLRQEKRPWSAVLAALLQAGEGLAAAHRAGIVHRDFKPDNVLVGEDGRVRVVDFGLARHEEVTESSPGELDKTSVDLTQAGAFIGTPAYMAPEQLRREPADALSDQFSFCVALFEALHGVRPFKGETTASITEAVLHNRRRDPPRDSPVPGWVQAAVIRGLSIDPAQRYPSMEALLAALAADPSRARRRRLGIAAVVVGFGVAATLGGLAAAELAAREAAACSGARERLAGVWDPTVAASVRGALHSTGIGYADEVADRVDAGLGRYADAWVAAREEACEAHRRGDQSDSLHDLRVACLDDRRTALDALAVVLAGADATVLEQATEAVERLPSLASCGDARRLLAERLLPADPAVEQAIAGLRQRLAEARAKFDVGQYRAAKADVAALRADAEPLDHPPTLAQILALAGAIDDALGEYPVAEATLIEAAALADRAGDDEVRAAVLIELIRVVGVRSARFDEGLRVGTLARGVVGRLADGAREGALLEGRLGDLYLQRGDLDRAEAHIERAVAERARIDGEASIAHGRAISARATLRFLRGEYEAALAEYRRALSIFEEAYGPNHPALGEVLNNIGAAELSLLRVDAAEGTYRRTLALLGAAYGESHPSLATVHSNLGLIAQLQGAFPASLAEFDRARAIYEGHLPADHPSLGDCWTDLGNTHLFAGEAAAAEDAYGRALAIFDRSLGTGHERTTRSLILLAQAQLRGAHLDAAEASLRRAIDEHRRDGAPTGEEPLVLGGAYSGLGEVLLARGRTGEALADLEKGLALLAADPAAAPYEVARAEFALARALRSATPTDAGRSEALARAAKARYEGVGAAFVGAAAEVDAWLRAAAAAAAAPSASGG